jgi:hypothetical protein
MGPAGLPPIWDPSRAVDKLPQPYRMIDKLVADIIGRALAEISVKAEQRRLARAIKIDTVRSGLLQQRITAGGTAMQLTRCLACMYACRTSRRMRCWSRMETPRASPLPASVRGCA